MSPLTNITPFTYRDGTTYMEILEKFRVYVNETMRPEFNTEMQRIIDDFQAGILNVESRVVESETEYDALIAEAKAYVDASVQFINNKTGQAQIQRVTLTGPYTLTIDPVWPNNHPIHVVLTQDATGGRAVTWDEDITGTVPIDPAPGAVTAFTLVPQGDGSWVPVQYLTAAEMDAEITAINTALGTKANASSVTASLALKADTTALTTEVTTLNVALNKRVSFVNTFAELQAAVAAGGTVRVGTAPLTFTSEILITAPVRIEGGVFLLPENAGYPCFRVTTSNVSFRGCSFDGPGTTAAYDINSRFIYAHGTGNGYLKNVNVTDCVMTGSQTECIRFNTVKDSVIERNVMDDFLYAGVLLLSCEDMVISSNTITNAIMKAPVVNVYGIAATDATNVEETRSRNIKIIGNTLRNIMWEGIDTHGGEAIIITGNTVIGCPRGIALVSGSETRLTVPEDCVVSGNYVDLGAAAMTDREGIGLFGLTANLAHATITGNIVKGYLPGKNIYTGAFDPYKTLVEGNSHPHVDWTPVVMNNTGAWTSHPDNRFEYMVDGRNVYFRGLVNAEGAQTTDSSLIGALPSVARPNNLSFPKNLRGAAGTSTTTGTLGVYSNGEIFFLYRNNATGTWAYAMDCSYQRRYTG